MNLINTCFRYSGSGTGRSCFGDKGVDPEDPTEKRDDEEATVGAVVEAAAENEFWWDNGGEEVLVVNVVTSLGVPGVVGEFAPLAILEFETDLESLRSSSFKAYICL